MATVLFVEGSARDPRAPSLFQVADMAKPPAGSSLFNKGGLCSKSLPHHRRMRVPRHHQMVDPLHPSTPTLLLVHPCSSEPLLTQGASQRNNGSYRIVLEGVDEIDWFTDHMEVCNGEGIGKEELPTQVSLLENKRVLTDSSLRYP